MASLRKKGTVWYACIALPGAKRTQVTTKKRDVGTPAERADARRQAMLIAQALEELALGDPTEVHIRRTLNSLFERVGKRTRLAMPAEAFFAEWVQRTKLHKAKSTHSRYASIAKGFLRSLGARRSVSMAEITIGDVQTWLDAELTAGKRISSVTSERQSLGIPFASALKQGLISLNPVALTELPQYRRRPGRLPFSEAQIGAILRTATGDWLTASMLGAFTGARIGDACNMRWSAVDLANGLLRYMPEKTKHTGNEVVVPLHPALAQYLRLLSYDGAQPGPVVMGAAVPVRGEFLAPSLANRPVGGTRGLSTHFKAILHSAGIVTANEAHDGPSPTTRRGRHRTSCYTFHSFRFSFATRLANAGVAQEIRMKLVGHTTEQIHAGYTTLALETLRGAVLNLPGIEAARPTCTAVPVVDEGGGEKITAPAGAVIYES